MHRITTTLLFLFLALVATPTQAASCLPATPSSPVEISFETGLEGFTNEVEAYPGYAGLDYFQRNGPSPTTGPTTGMVGTGYLYLQFPGGTGPDDWAAALYSPCFDLSQLNQPQLIMSMFQRNPQILATFIQVSTDGGQTWLYPPATTPVKYQYPGQREAGWVDAVLDLTPFAGASDFRFRLGVSAPPANDQEVAFDYVRIGEALCTTDLGASLVSQTTTGSNDGAIDLTVTNATGPLSYTWSNGATTEDLSGLSPDYYGVTVMDSLGCFNEEKVYVSDPLACNGTKSGGYPYSYDFENNGLGLLKQNQDDDTNWRRRTGDTPTPLTGPQSWQPFPYGSQYRHIEAGNGNSPRTGVLSVKK
ncbi:MAG: SprB repeat-containing protein, partial [Bacteroidota bacterium]